MAKKPKEPAKRAMMAMADRITEQCVGRQRTWTSRTPAG